MRIHRAFRPAFVLTIASASSLGCETRTENPPPPTPAATAAPRPATAPAPTAAGATTSTPPPEEGPKRTRKRTVRADLPKRERFTGDMRGLTAMNPSDAKGRPIYTARDGRCFVRVPLSPDAPPRPAGAPGTRPEYVDCPEAMDNPAWDTCFHGTLSKTADGDCLCAATHGNPPPPPYVAECPKPTK